MLVLCYKAGVLLHRRYSEAPLEFFYDKVPITPEVP